jgi:outer membrane protein OmpA-like peptidoglycan-associated protein
MKFHPLIIFLSVLIIGCAAKISPILIEKAVSDAQSALKGAKEAGALEYAYAEYTRAQKLMEEALKSPDPARRLDLSQKAFLYARIAEAKSRYLSTQERLSEIESEKMKLLIDRMAEQVAEAQARRAIAEHRMREAESRAQTAHEAATEAEAKADAAQREMLKQIAKSRAELAIAKAELALQAAEEANASRYAGEQYGQAALKLEAARKALNSNRFDEAARLASEAEEGLKEARTSALAVAEAQKRQVELSQQQLYTEALISIEKADLLLQIARSFNAERFASKRFDDARVKLDRARRAISEKKYREARDAAVEAEKSALAVQRLAQMKWKEAQISASEEELEAQAKDAIFKAETAISESSDLKGQSPDIYRMAESALTQAKKAVEEGDYQLALILGSQAAMLIENVRGISQELKKVESELISKLSKVGRFEVQRIPEGVLVRISGDLFAPGGSNINPKHRASLRKLAGILKGYPQFTVLIEGHTDSIGEAEDNLKLSIARAVKFRDFLVNQGIKGSRLIPIGYGESRPIASNINESGRRRNRRIDLIIFIRRSL